MNRPSARDLVREAANAAQLRRVRGFIERAKASGASKLIQYDLREEFASDYLWPLIRSGAIYERKYLLGTSVARPSRTASAIQTNCRYFSAS